MSRKINAFKMIMIGLLWVVPAGIWLTGGALAAESASGIRSIPPMGEMGSYRQQSNFMAENYFDIVGILNLMENDRIIVGDQELAIAPGVSMPRTRQWNLVGVKLNHAGEVVVFETISDEPN